MRLAMIGAGYVGLVSGACFPEFGFDVVCVDKDADKIRRLGRGEKPPAGPVNDFCTYLLQTRIILLQKGDFSPHVVAPHLLRHKRENHNTLKSLNSFRAGH